MDDALNRLEFFLIGFMLFWIFYQNKKISSLEKNSECMQRDLSALRFDIKCWEFAEHVEEVTKKKRGRPPKSIENKNPQE